jgi:calcineurin-like phosphoesterase family protein
MSDKGVQAMITIEKQDVSDHKVRILSFNFRTQLKIHGHLHQNRRHHPLLSLKLGQNHVQKLGR